jgi:hypothetical protein
MAICAHCSDDCSCRIQRRCQRDDKGLYSLPPADDNLSRRAVDAFAFVAAIDDPSRFRRSLDVYAYVSGEVDYTGGISKCGDKWCER